MGGYSPGYLSSTELLDVNSMKWRTGPSLPIAVRNNRGVQSVSGTYLGFSTGGTRKKIGAQRKVYGLRKTGTNGLEWEEVHSMTAARAAHSVVNAPKSLLPNCGKGNFNISIF